jgi:DNA-binding SARP family transcriptional activator
LVVRISVLGPLAVAVDGEDSPVGGPTQRRLIAALAVAAIGDAALPVNDLIDEVYREDLPPRPRRSLATLVWRLRQRWGSDAISFDGYSYQLNPACCSVDAAEFERQIYRGRALARDGAGADAAATLRRALELWPAREEPDPGLPRPERDRLVELRLGAMDRLAQLLAQSGRHAPAIELLERIVAARPEWEHSQAQLIGCHLDGGSIADGLRVYDGARRALMEQGVEPGPDLTRAAARLAALTDATSGARLPNPRRPPASVAADHRPGPEDMVGRARELARACRTVTACLAASRSTGVVISGEPGIGKSTLARAVLRSVGAGSPSPTVLTLACDPRRTLPYAPFAALASDSEDDPLSGLLLAGDGQPAARRGVSGNGARELRDAEEIHAALLARVRALAGDGGLVVLIEDLHWASSETVRAAAALLAGTVERPVAVVTTTRDDSLPDALASHVSCHLRLRGLDVGAVSALLGEASQRLDPPHLHRLTGGNPLYVQQMRQAGSSTADDLPDGVDTAIGIHLSMVSPAVRETLEIASVAGDRFNLSVLAALTGPLRRPRPVWVDRLQRARQLGLIDADLEAPGDFAFVHTLVRERLYRRMPAERRTVAHAEIGRALDRIALGRRCPADLLAHHYTRGWPDTTTGEVVDKLAAAARAASVQLDFGQAVAHYRTALDHLAMDPESASSPVVADILGAAAGSAAASGDLVAANELYESQYTFAENAGLTSARIYAALGALRTQYARRAQPQVADQLASALEDAIAVGAVREDADLMGEALAAVQVYRPRRSEQLLDEMASAAPELASGLRLAVWEHRTVSDQLASARQLADDPAADPVAVWLRLWVSEVASGERALDDPPPRSAPASRADEQTRFDVSQWRIATLIATGRLARARRLIDEALAAPRHPDPAENARRMASYYGQRTLLGLAEDRLPAAQRSPELANPTWASRHPIMRYVIAYMLALGGDHGHARERCDDLLDEVQDADIPESDLLPRLMLLSDACQRSGHRTGLEPCLAHLLPHRGEHAIFRFGQYWGAAHQSIGGLQIALGDLDSGIDALRCAVEEFDAVHAVLYRPPTQRALADALERRGRASDRTEVRSLREVAARTDNALGLEHRASRRPGESRLAEVPSPRASTA